MTYPSRRFLESSANSPANEAPPQTEAVDSDFVVILASLLCALICVLGLIAVARCAWLRRLAGAHLPPQSAAANKGLKKKVLRSLPKLTFSHDLSPKLALSDCPICLSEFVPGDEIRILPHCAHAFHLSCIDTWLGSHSSCPSCRQILVVAMCQRCGRLPPEEDRYNAAADRARGRPTGGDHVDTFLP